MKIKVIERGETEFTASTEWTEPDIRAALGSRIDVDGAVRSAIYDTTDTERDTDPDEYITITEDDGTVLWSGWLTGDKGKPAPDARAGRDEARAMLREVRDILLEDGQDHLAARRRAIAVIDARPEVTR